MTIKKNRLPSSILLRPIFPFSPFLLFSIIPLLIGAVKRFEHKFSDSKQTSKLHSHSPHFPNKNMLINIQKKKFEAYLNETYYKPVEKHRPNNKQVKENLSYMAYCHY